MSLARLPNERRAAPIHNAFGLAGLKVIVMRAALAILLAHDALHAQTIASCSELTIFAGVGEVTG